MGGLGANIGSDKWELAQRKKEAAAKYAEEIRLATLANPMPTKKKEKPKEKTAREKALEFAKNVPKPQVKKVQVATDLPSKHEGYDDSQVGEGASEL